MVDFNLCIICQDGKLDQTVEITTDESIFNKFLECVSLRSDLRDNYFMTIQNGLKDFSFEQLKYFKAVWHRACYSSATHVLHIQRAQKRREVSESKAVKKLCTSEKETSSSTTLTRASIECYNKDSCFFCKNDSGTLHKCVGGNVHAQLSRIVAVSDNLEWKRNLSVLNFGTNIYFKYHNSCMVYEWQQLNAYNVAEDEDDDTEIQFIAAELEFFDMVQSCINSNEICSIKDLVDEYKNNMNYYNVECYHINERILLKKLRCKIKNVEFTRPSRRTSTLMHNSNVRNNSIKNEFEKDAKTDLQKIFDCANLIRHSISNLNDWEFNGSITLNSENICIELCLLLKWIIQGKREAKTIVRDKFIDIRCNNLAQQIIYMHKSKRQLNYTPKSQESVFRTTINTPLTTGLSLHTFNNTRSKKTVDLLNSAGI